LRESIEAFEMLQSRKNNFSPAKASFAAVWHSAVWVWQLLNRGKQFI